MWSFLLILIFVCNDVFSAHPPQFPCELQPRTGVFDKSNSILIKLNEHCIFLKSTLNNPEALMHEDSFDYRLPKNVKPVRYFINVEPNLAPDLDPATFNGSIEIELMAVENTNNITLHISDLIIEQSSIRIMDSNGLNITVQNITTDEEREFYIINLSNDLELDHVYTLTIGNYSGILNLLNEGFYLAKYEDSDGNERRLATTQFQSIYARKAFPCFDEPALKATFIISLIRKKGYNSISNGAYINTVNLGNDRYQDFYEETVNMSTYLVAFVVSDFQYVEDEMNRQRVYAKPAEITAGTATYSLQQSSKILKILENYLKINYTLNKMDQIAIPDQYYSMSAMENWGLVTYGESKLLYSNDTATTNELQSIDTLIGHEFAHQWFGNLVTLSWWKYIWLNEGFATYFEYFATAIIHPNWRLQDQFVVDIVQRALAADSTAVTSPMKYESPTPGKGPPTWVSYHKAASVIRMFKHFLTRNVFRNGLILYLNRRRFQSVEPADLYEALQDTLNNENKTTLLQNLTVSSILSTWDSIKGYPVVTVTRHYETGHLLLTQSKFRQGSSTDDNTDIWYIPINYVFGSLRNTTNFSNTTADLWLTKRNQTIEFNYPTASWIIVNKKQTGFYRVNYDLTNWNRIIRFLRGRTFRSIHVLNRAQLIDDAFNLASSGRLDYGIPLNMSIYLAREGEYIPLYSFLEAHIFLDRMLAATNEYQIYKEFVNNLLSRTFRKLGVEELNTDKHVDKLLRAMVLTHLCRNDHAECQNFALTKLRAWINNDANSITPNLQPAYFCGALKLGNQSDWDFLYQKYEESNSTSLRFVIIEALGCSTNVTILEKYLDKIHTNSTLRTSDWYSVFRSVYNSGNFGLSVAFNYLKNHFSELNERTELFSILIDISYKFTTRDQYNELADLARNHSEARPMISVALAAVNRTINWANKNVVNITQWLSELPSVRHI